ncbi:MAG: hypothetical protein GY711_33095 [bacterium]|nr:hypothetical protein [bacterium]
MTQLTAISCLLLASTASGQWTTGALSVARAELAATSIGTRAFFAGGKTTNPIYAVVDIYDAHARTWSTASLSTARFRLAATSANGRAFFAGGRNWAGPVSRVDIFDDATDTWTTAELSQGRDQLAAASASGKVLFAGGRISTGAPASRVDIYDSQTGTWTTHELSVARSAPAATAVGSLVLFAGGDAGGGFGDQVDVYDTLTDTWSTSQLPTGRSNPAAASDAGRAFFAGSSNTVDIFDTSNATWTTDTLALSRSYLAATSVGPWVVLAGGTSSTTVDLYNSSTRTWTTASLSVARRQLAAASVGGVALFAGGRAVNGSNAFFDRVDLFEPELGVPYCSPANPNSSGVPARISADGSPFVADLDFTVIAQDIPAGEFGYFLVGSNQGAFQPPGSQGVLCLACGFQGCSGIGRFNQSGSIVQGPTGSIDVDLTSLPLSPPAAVQPGETWNFQCWFRDVGSSNFTDAISVTFL